MMMMMMMRRVYLIYVLLFRAPALVVAAAAAVVGFNLALLVGVGWVIMFTTLASFFFLFLADLLFCCLREFFVGFK